MRSLVCTAWFDLALKSLPRPLLPPIFQNRETHGHTAAVSGTKRKRDVTDIGEPADTQQVHLKLRTERKRFKNFRIHFTKLPEAPRSRSGRSLSPAAEWGQTIGSSDNPHSAPYCTGNVFWLRVTNLRERFWYRELHRLAIGT